MTDFIDCTSLNISYDVMGRATVTYTVTHSEAEFVVYKTINAGGRTFSGYITNASMNQIPNTNWYETHATLLATTD